VHSYFNNIIKGGSKHLTNYLSALANEKHQNKTMNGSPRSQKEK